MRVLPHQSKRIITVLSGIILAIFFRASVAWAAPLPKSIKLVSEPWVNATQEDGVGIYWDIMRLVYEPLGIKVEYKTTDYARSVALVKKGERDAWIGSYLDEEKGVIYPRWHIDADVVSALYKKSSAFQWQGQNSLKGKKVGWIKGYNYDRYIDVKFNNKEFLTRSDAVKLLARGQLDFFLEAQVEIKNELKMGYCNAAELEYKTLMNLNIYPAFASNERGRQLQAIFDRRFAKLLESGEIKTLFEKWNWPTYPFTIFCTYATSSMINC